MLDALGVCLGLVDLVHGNDNRDLGRLCVVKCLEGLFLDTLFGGDDQDDHIGDLRALEAHRGECLMAGSIDEDDGLALDLDLVGADLLGDATLLTAGDATLADEIQ